MYRSPSNGFALQRKDRDANDVSRKRLGFIDAERPCTDDVDDYKGLIVNKSRQQLVNGSNAHYEWLK